jgi:hypothetical protein
MAVALVAYRFGFLSPGATVGVYLHGFSPDWFVAYCVTPFRSPARPGAFFPEVELRVGSVSIASDGTIARKAFVTNQSVSNGALPSPAVNLNALIETIQR